jgi:hypothetical protein
MFANPLDPAVVVLHVAGGGQELMLTDHDPVARLQMQGGDVTRGVTAERDLTRRLRLDQQQRQAAEHAALEALLERMQADLHVRVLPQENVVLEVDRDLPIERHVQHRNELALQPVAQTRRPPLRDLSRQDGWGCRHRLSLVVDGGGTACRPPPVSRPHAIAREG